MRLALGSGSFSGSLSGAAKGTAGLENRMASPALPTLANSGKESAIAMEQLDGKNVWRNLI
jgi:hypothetical protein